MSEVDPKGPIYDSAARHPCWPWLARVGTLAALGITALILWRHLSSPGAQSQAVLLALAAAWAIGAPLWFFVEFHFFYRRAAAPGSWDLFKHGQQLAIAVWAGLTAGIYVVAASDLAKPPKDTEQCSLLVVTKGSDPAVGTKVIKCPK